MEANLLFQVVLNTPLLKSWKIQIFVLKNNELACLYFPELRSVTKKGSTFPKKSTYNFKNDVKCNKYSVNQAVQFSKFILIIINMGNFHHAP